MGFLDDISSTFNKGTAAASRTGRKAQLKMQLNDTNRQRQDLMAQLGASLYETVKNDPQLSAGKEQLLASISEIDSKRTDLQNEITQIEEESASVKAANTKYACTKCGTTVLASDSFCPGCGKPVPEIISEREAEFDAQMQADVADEPDAGPKCPNCGAEIKPDDMFCTSCGSKIG